MQTQVHHLRHFAQTAQLGVITPTQAGLQYLAAWHAALGNPIQIKEETRLQIVVAALLALTKTRLVKPRANCAQPARITPIQVLYL